MSWLGPTANLALTLIRLIMKLVGASEDAHDALISLIEALEPKRDQSVKSRRSIEKQRERLRKQIEKVKAQRDAIKAKQG